jgi:hypothetical protein
MLGRNYLDLAREILAGGTEVHWRGAVGRAYYALMLEGRDALARWGFPLPPQGNAHHFVRTRFSFPADAHLKQIGRVLDHAGRLRNKADYDLSALPAFRSAIQAQQAIQDQDVTAALALLDAIDADAGQRTAAVAAIRPAFP